VGTDGTKSDSYAYNATLYASYRFLPHTFLDAIAGYGRMNFTLSRWSSDGDLFLAGNRGGSDVYGSLVLTQVFKWDAWKLSPYTRLDVVHIDLDAYSETGSSIWDLSYNELSSTTVSAVLGTRVAYTIPERWGLLIPTARFEYSHALTGAYNQTMSYTGLPGTNYIVSATPVANDLFTGGLGLRAETAGGF
jgi:outer membrane autotransporter protein